MKLELITKIENSTPLYVGKEGSYVLNIDKQSVYKTIDFKVKAWEIEGLNGKVYIDGDYVVLFANDRSIAFVDHDRGEILDIEDCSLIEAKETTEGVLFHKILVYKNSQRIDGKRVRDVGYLNLKEDEFQIIKEKFEFNNIISTTNGFIVKRKHDFIRFDSMLENENWKFSMSKLEKHQNHWGDYLLSKVKNILGIYKNVLWVHVSGLRLIGIDVESGEMIHNIKGVLLGGEDNGNNMLDKESGILRIFAQNIYREYDLHHLTIIKDYKIDLEKELVIRDATFYNDDKYVYFSAYYDEAFPNTIGVFDSEVCQIVCMDIMESNDSSNAFFNAPLANDDFVVIRDNNNTLLVYSKE